MDDIWMEGRIHLGAFGLGYLHSEQDAMVESECMHGFSPGVMFWVK